MNRVEAIAYAQVALKSLKEFEVPITTSTLFLEMDALMWEYTERQIVKELKKL